MEDIISGEIDIYDQLGVQRDASSLQIAKAFRRKALQLHPDKNPSPRAHSEFQLLTVINSILSDPDLRAGYDRLRGHVKSSETTETANWDTQVQEFRNKLQRAEATKNSQLRKEEQRNAHTAGDLAKLEMDGLKLRYEYQLRKETREEYVSFRDIDQEQIIEHLSPSAQVEVQWKQKEGQDAAINEQVLAEIMSIFGVVVLCHTTEGDGRYAMGNVIYKRAEDAQKAANHNYRESAVLWNGTKYRKRASLLRGCKVVEVDPRIQVILDEI